MLSLHSYGVWGGHRTAFFILFTWNRVNIIKMDFFSAPSTSIPRLEDSLASPTGIHRRQNKQANKKKFTLNRIFVTVVISGNNRV